MSCAGTGSLRWKVLFVLAVAVHLLALYLPRVPSQTQGWNLDKLGHVAVFGVVLLTAWRAGLPPRPVAAVLLLHAVLSEVAQGTLLPGRSGDWRDVVADVAGVLLAAALVRRRARSLERGDPADARAPLT